MSYEDVLKSALENAVERQRTARRRSMIYTLIPVIMAVILIGVTWWQVSNATKQYNETKQKLDTTNAQLVSSNGLLTQSQGEYNALQKELTTAQQDIAVLKDQSEKYQQDIERLGTDVENYRKEVDQLRIERDGLQKAIDELGAQIEQSQGLKRYIYTDNMTLVLKSMYDDKAFNLLFYIWGLQPESQTKWHPGGIGPDQFDSPGFAVDTLIKFKAIEGDPEKIHYSLINILKPVTTPTDGDIVFYEEGYTMFYFWDSHEGQPFVIGMTPLGIVALKYDFAPIRMIGDVTYP